MQHGLSDTFAWRDLPTESSRQVGPFVETVTITGSTLTVSYRGPPIPKEVEDRLMKWWAARIEAITWRLLGLSPPSEDTPVAGLGSPSSGGPVSGSRGSAKGPITPWTWPYMQGIT